MARMKPILDRIPAEWGKYLPMPGWDDLLLSLDRALAAIDPDYTILQAKEKFGVLRFYPQWSDDLLPEPKDRSLGYELIGNAEHQSAHICERCGSLGATARPGGWIKTLCDTCFNERRVRI